MKFLGFTELHTATSDMPAYFMLNDYDSRSYRYVQKWQNLTKKSRITKAIMRNVPIKQVFVFNLRNVFESQDLQIK